VVRRRPGAADAMLLLFDAIATTLHWPEQG
jgi:hypothetical protein